MNALVRVRSLFDAVFHVQRLRAQLTPEGQTLLDALLAHRSVLRHRMRPVLDGALAAPARGDETAPPLQLLLAQRSPQRHVFGPSDRLLLFSTRLPAERVLAAAGVESVADDSAEARAADAAAAAALESDDAPRLVLHWWRVHRVFPANAADDAVALLAALHSERRALEWHADLASDADNADGEFEPRGAFVERDAPLPDALPLHTRFVRRSWTGALDTQVDVHAEQPQA